MACDDGAAEGPGLPRAEKGLQARNMVRRTGQSRASTSLKTPTLPPVPGA